MVGGDSTVPITRNVTVVGSDGLRCLTAKTFNVWSPAPSGGVSPTMKALATTGPLASIVSPDQTSTASPVLVPLTIPTDSAATRPGRGDKTTGASVGCE